MKARRNKTIDLSVEEGFEYLHRCITVKSDVQIDQITNRTILGDTFSIAKYLPKGFVDLMIVDPPYNVDKDFNLRGLNSPPLAA